MSACNALPTCPLRDTEHLDVEREALVAAYAVMHMAANMRARSSDRSAASPNSAWDAYKRARHVLAEWGCKLPPLSAVRKTLKGLLRSYVGKYGDEVLAPNRKRPFYRMHEDAMLKVLEGDSLPAWTRAQKRMIKRAMAFGRCTGARKAELCKDGGDHHFTRGHATWYVKGREVAPTLANIARADRLRLRPTASKADPYNMHWGAHEMWFDVVEGEHFSVALALRDLELEFPCPESDRLAFPLFFDPSRYAPGSAPEPFTRATLTHRFGKLMETALGAGVAGERSWHSWRTTLACSLRAAVDTNHPDGRSLQLVKMFGRWRSDDSVELYGRLSPSAYAQHVSASLRADAATIAPEGAAQAERAVDPIDILEHVAACAESTDDEETVFGAAASHASAPPRAKPSRPRPRPRVRASQTAPGTTPLQPDPSRPPNSSKVLVPARCFPHERCNENDGTAWSAYATSISRKVARVTFAHARDAKQRGAPTPPLLCNLMSFCIRSSHASASCAGAARGREALPPPLAAHPSRHPSSASSGLVPPQRPPSPSRVA